GCKQSKTGHGEYNAICDEWNQPQSQGKHDSQQPDQEGTQAVHDTSASPRVIAMMHSRFTQ
ncbi:hypothetical protein HAX54_014583, partial [Datura stramonium]|nr:hypothetical protein [Datura stramonium]